MFTKEKIDTLFHGDIIGKEIIFLETATSTNDVAIETGMRRENPEGLVIVADSQSHGKGRLGRKWISPPGVNLYFTVLLRPLFPPGEASILTLTAAVAVVSAIRNYTGVNAGIKWPNDILINGKKAGGVLLEMKAADNRINLLAVGIGLNVNMSPDELPEDIKSLSTSIKIETGEYVDRGKLLGKILAEIENTYKILLNGNKRALINEWIRLNFTLGNKVTVRNYERVISGIAENINDSGELVIRLPSGERETVSGGDVTIVKG